jgi:hypothetical protein
MSTRRKIYGFFLFVLLLTNQSFGQQLDPHTILLFQMEGEGRDLSLTQPQVLTGFNAKGYNNQPAFFPNGEIWLTSQWLSDTNQTEIVALNPTTRQLAEVTKTKLSEYSPTPMPGGKEWSGVVVEADGSQRLWAFPIKGGGSGKPLLPDIKGVGYHVWLTDIDLALFIVGEPHTLVTTNTLKQKRNQIASNPGRCLLKNSKGLLYYVSKATEQTWFLKSYNPTNGKQEIVCQTLPGSEDFALLSGDLVLMGQGSKLYLRFGESWIQIADLSSLGVKKISRLAVRGNQLAMVVD